MSGHILSAHLPNDEERCCFLDPGSSVIQAGSIQWLYMRDFLVCMALRRQYCYTCNLQMGKLKPREVKQLSQSHTARKRARIWTRHSGIMIITCHLRLPLVTGNHEMSPVVPQQMVNYCVMRKGHIWEFWIVLSESLWGWLWSGKTLWMGGAIASEMPKINHTTVVNC